MKASHPTVRLMRILMLFSIICAVMFVGAPAAIFATDLPPTAVLTYLQTNAPASPLTKGDWYTNNTAGTGGGYHYVTIDVPCAWPTTSPIDIDLFSPEMNTNAPTADENDAGIRDNTTFELYSPSTPLGPGAAQPAPGAAGTLLTVNYPTSSAAQSWVRFHTLAAPVTCGRYILRSQARDDDQNSWRLRIGDDNDADPTNTPPSTADNPDGIAGTGDELTTGLRQMAFQHDQTVAAQQCVTLYEYVAPSQPSVTFNNFDTDGNIRIRYYAPSAAYDPLATAGGVVGTLSPDSSWNNGSSTTRGGDVIANPEAGWWRIVSCVISNNQYIQEGQSSAQAYFEQPPTPRLTLSKSDAQTQFTANQLITYQLVFANTSNATATPGAATTIVLQDTVPANTTYISCAFVAPIAGVCSLAAGVVTFTINGVLAAGATGKVSVTVRANNSYPGSTPATPASITNTVSATYKDSLGNSFPTLNASDIDTLATAGVIGDRVWLDSDGDGVQDVGEAGLANIAVQLWAAGADGLVGTADDVLVGSRTTDANGAYLFANLPPNSYYVQVDASTVPTNLTLAPGSASPTTLIALTAGQKYLQADFGYMPSAGTAVIGDYIWSDADSDGIQDPGEPGIGGVTVDLRSAGIDGIFGTADDVTVSTATTNAGGTYLFTGVAAGEYRVVVTDVANVLAGATLTSGPQSSTSSTPVSVVAGANYLAADYGYIRPATFSVSDRLWYDADGDGTVDAGEQFVGGVTVNLLNAAGVVIATTTSDSTGNFSFPNLPDGAYTIQIADSAGVLNGYGGTTVNAIATQRSVTVAGANVSGTNFGYRIPGSIGDTVWNDVNNNGLQEANELGIAGVTIQLWSETAGAGFSSIQDTLIATVTTDAQGHYSFQNLLANTYYVSISAGQPVLTGYTALTPDQELGPNAAGIQLTIALAAGAVIDTADFRYQNSAVQSVSGNVWNDINRNAFDEGAGEPGIAGVEVVLRDSTGAIIATTTTNASGDYTFANVRPGNYTVQVSYVNNVLRNYMLTSGSDAIPVTVAGINITGINFGYAREATTASIGDYIWLDSDRDGAQDSSERGLGGVEVELRSPGPDGIAGNGDDTTLATTVTNASGLYQFANLAAGAYYVRVNTATLPTGLAPTAGATNATALIALSEAEAYTRADIGYASAAGSALGDRVWYDSDGDAVQDAGEIGIGGVKVTVSGPSGTFVVFTDADGAWLVPGLAPGSYTVTVDTTTLPAGYNPIPTNGTAGASRIVTVLSGEDVLYADWGFNGGTTGSIGDQVFYDANANGIQDGGETGISNVMLSLFTAGADGLFGTSDDVMAGTTTTNATGGYSFSGLPAGNYRVQVSDINDALRGLRLSAGSNPTATITLALGQVYTSADFGYAPAGGVIGNLVWRDLNGDGNVDSGEPGLGSVSVNLWRDINSDGIITPGVDNLVRSVVSDVDGRYTFEGLPAGAYIVDVTDTAGVLAGFNRTSGTANTDNNSQIDPYPVTLLTGGSVVTADFGYAAATSHTISGTAFFDKQANGVFDGSDTRVQVVRMTLHRDLNGNGLVDPGEPLLDTISTDTNGNYLFTNLPNGNYVVTANANESWVSGARQTTQTISNPAQPVVIANANSANNNFGYAIPNAPTAVAMVSFNAQATASSIRVRWQTSAEENTLGYRVYRSTDGKRSSAALVTPELIAAHGPNIGYLWEDSAVVAGVTYSYWVAAINSDSSAAEYGPATGQIAAVDAYRIFLPFTVR